MKYLASLIAAAALNLPALAAGGAVLADTAGGATQLNTAATPTATLTINFSNISEPTGQIMAVLFDSEAEFNRGGKPVRALMVPVDGTAETTQVEGLPTGRYGIKLFHDIDGDGKMATNPFGIPTEPYAFSNNAVGSMGPAKWTDAAFDLAGPTTQQITFR